MKTKTTINITNADGKAEKRTFYSRDSLLSYLNKELRKAEIKKDCALNASDRSVYEEREKRISGLIALYQKTDNSEEIERRSFGI